MTIIRILLIGGLVYIGLQQKKRSTRNTILVVTGLLAFCMMGKEGLQVIDETIVAVAATPETCTPTVAGDGTDCSTGYIAGDAATPSSTCPSGCSLVNAVDAVGAVNPRNVATDAPGRLADMAQLFGTECVSGATIGEDGMCGQSSTTDNTTFREGSDRCSTGWISTRFHPDSQNEGNCCNPGGILDGDCPP